MCLPYRTRASYPSSPSRKVQNLHRCLRTHIILPRSSLTAILVSRFLLHLQSAKHRTAEQTAASFTLASRSYPEVTSIQFDRVLGSLSQSLSPEDYLYSSDDLDDNSDNSSKVYGMRDRGGGRGDSPARSAGFEVIELPLRIAAGDDDV